MRLCIFEDNGVPFLEPLTLTRPAFDLQCGASTLLDKQRRWYRSRATNTAEVGALVRPNLAELCRLVHPSLEVNDPGWFNRGDIVLVNARWLPPAQPLEDWRSPRVGLVDGQVAYVVLPFGSSPPPAMPECQPDSTAFGTIDTWTETWKQTLPHCPVGGCMIDYPWDLVENLAPALCREAAHFREWQQGPVGPTPAVVGPADQFLVHHEAAFEPFVTVDTRLGPVIIDRGVVVHSFSRLQGPCYIGPETWIMGAKIGGSSIGPRCRVGGEVESCIVQGYSNKCHDGFLGHSYLGEWVNLGAGTQVSDLRNDYGPVRANICGERVATGLTKVGVFLGDHTKTGLGSLLNCGTVAGAFCNLLPCGGLLPTVIPSFCQVENGQVTERHDLRQAFATADTVMRRRDKKFTGTHLESFFTLYETTAPARQRLIRETDTRRWRKSV